MNPIALQKITYGMYVVGSYKEDKLNGQLANTVVQVTSEPPMVAVSINKNNLTHDYIKNSRVFSANILCEAAPLSYIGNFGFKSGRDVDKLKNTNYKVGLTGAPIFPDNAVAYIEAEVVSETDAVTHTVFIGKVVGAEVLNDNPCMTYEYYHQVKRGTTPKSAPSYIGKK
jgi:ferric-chelate reductase [NAD(P)H]